MLQYTLNKEQYNTLRGLAYWVADENYIRERHGASDPELAVCRDTITKSIFPELDRLQVPFWVQNSVIAIAENWRQYKQRYFSELLKEKNIYVGCIN